jgi:hypothetical protein
VREGINGFTFDPYNIGALARLMFQVSRLEVDRLATIGEESLRTSAAWGLERFASGFAAAAECARWVGPKTASLLDRLLMRALMFR